MGKKKSTQSSKAAAKSSKSSGSSKETSKNKNNGKAAKPVAAVSEEDEEEEYWRMMEEASKRGHKKGSSPKKPLEDVPSDEEEESSDDSDSEDEELRFDTVEHISEQYTFEFKDMKEAFSEGICTLLQHSFLDNPTHAYELATHITAQETVGTVVVCEDGDDVFAFATICPLYKIKSVSIDKFTTSLSSSLRGSNDNSSLMQSYLTGEMKKHCGLLIHRRFANLPLQLVSHLHSNLNDDMSWAASLLDKLDDAGDSTSAQDHIDFKNIDHMILFSACGVLDTTSNHDKKRKKGEDSSSSGNNNAIDVTGSSSVILDYFEDDVYFQESLCSFYFKPSGANTPFVASLISVKSLAKIAATIVSLVPTAGP